jgi:hypothetical protein
LIKKEIKVNGLVNVSVVESKDDKKLKELNLLYSQGKAKMS